MPLLTLLHQVLDEDSGWRYHLHAVTGETRWAEDESEGDVEAAPATVWEELKDPVTGLHYYYSNSNGNTPSPRSTTP